MKFIVLYLIFIYSTLCAQTREYLSLYARQLDSIYRVLLNDPESYDKQRAFFCSFPHDFQSFKKTYDYTRYPKNLLYYMASDHIRKGFNQLNKIPETEYYDRLINLSLGGKWEADAIDELQVLLWERTREKPDVLFSLLSKYPKDKIYSFWYFYFHSLYLHKDGIPDYLLKMKDKYPGIYSELLKAFKNADGEAIEETIN